MLPLHEGGYGFLLIYKTTGLLYKQIGVLEYGCVTGVRVNNQIGFWDILRHINRIDRRNRDVVLPLNDQCGLCNGFKLVKCIRIRLRPGQNCFQLCRTALTA